MVNNSGIINALNPSDTKGFGTTSDTKEGVGRGGGRADPPVIS